MDARSPPARLIMGFSQGDAPRPLHRAPVRRKSLLSVRLGGSAGSGLAREGSAGMPSVDSIGDLSSVAEGEAQQAHSLGDSEVSEPQLHLEEAASPSEHAMSAALPIPYTR
jgi:hypothetical protein